MKKIKLSIIVPCYKVEKYLPKCLDSLVMQTLKEIEIICINDGSPDDCLKILKEYKKRFGNKIVIIDKNNEGVWKGRKDGIKIAKGEFIGFVDSDDYVTEDFAEKLYSAAVRNKADIAVCGFDRIDLETEKLYSREMCDFKYKNVSTDNMGLLVEVNSSLWNKIYKADLLKNMVSLKNVPIILEDVMFLQLVYIRTCKIIFVNNSLYRYMVRKKSTINNIDEKLLPKTYVSMKEVRDIYVKLNKSNLEYVDACAFLHLGVSLMYRLSNNDKIDFRKELSKNRQVLDCNFPTWKNNKYIKLNYVIKNRGVNFKFWAVSKIYKLHLLGIFLSVYNFMINRLKIDIKW